MWMLRSNMCTSIHINAICEIIHIRERNYYIFGKLSHKNRSQQLCTPNNYHESHSPRLQTWKFGIFFLRVNYNGSLTMQLLCNPVVRWIIFKKTIKIAKVQVSETKFYKTTMTSRWSATSDLFTEQYSGYQRRKVDHYQ